MQIYLMGGIVSVLMALVSTSFYKRAKKHEAIADIIVCFIFSWFGALIEVHGMMKRNKGKRGH